MLVWDKISGVRGGRAVSVVRVQLDMADGAVVGGLGEESMMGRSLGLREVQLWAWLDQFGDCKSSDECVHGFCAGVDSEHVAGKNAGVCVCDANWFGARCDTSILHSSQFLPPPLSEESMAGLETRCAYKGCEQDDPMVDSALLDRTVADIASVQGIEKAWHGQRASGREDIVQGHSCSSEQAISFFFENRGLAATMLHIAGLLGFSFLQRRALVLSQRHPWVYTDADTCPQRDLQCYFATWSRCQPQAQARLQRVSGNDVKNDGELREDQRPYEALREGSFLAGGRDNLVRDFNLAIPSDLQHKGIFWWRLASVSVLWRIRADIWQELAVDAVKQRIGFQHPIIAMHVRRGDSCHTSLRRNRCRSLLANLHGVEVMAARYGTSRVFLATDSPAVKEELESLAPHLTFVSIDSFNRSSLEASIMHCSNKHPDKTDDGLTLEDGCTGNDAWLEHRLGRGYVQQRELALATLLDLTLMSHADYFVGHFASNLSRLAYLLAVAHHRRMIPYWSVDGPWCYHWRMCCDVQVDGTSVVC